MEFTRKTFKITENVSFSILIAYFDGHPICQTKSLKLMYHGQLQEMKSGNRLYESLIPKGLVTKEALDLLNYLSRLIYGENIYDVYINNSNQSDYVSEMKEYITHNQSASTDGLNNRFNLIEGVTNTSNQIDQEELNRHRNEDFPIAVHNFDEIELAPLFTYVHPNLTINRGETIHLCHFAFLLERLSHLSAYPEFNNQAIMSLLGNVFESDESGLTVEELTKDKYEEIIEENNKLKSELGKEKNDHKETKKLLQEIKKQNRDLRASNARIEAQNNEQKEMIEELLNLNLDSNQQITVMRKEIRNLNQDVNDMSTAITRVNEDVGVLTISNQKLNMVHDVFIIYFSEYKPVDEDKRNNCADEEIWLGTYNGQLSNYKRSVPADAYNLYQINSNRLDSYKFMTESQQLSEFILDTYQRSIKIRIADFHRFIDLVDNLMNSDGKYESIRNVQVINEAIKLQGRQHHEANAIINRKKHLLQQYNDIHINILRYNRVVYAKINEELVKVNRVNDAHNYDWFYKYGSNGCYTCQILEPLLNKNIFTNDYDRRINYE